MSKNLRDDLLSRAEPSTSEESATVSEWLRIAKDLAQTPAGTPDADVEESARKEDEALSRATRADVQDVADLGALAEIIRRELRAAGFSEHEPARAAADRLAAFLRDGGDDA